MSLQINTGASVQVCSVKIDVTLHLLNRLR